VRVDGASARFEHAALRAVGCLVPVGDRDGDCDDELVAQRPYEDESLELAGSAALAMLSGTHTRLSGNVTVLPEPRWEDAGRADVHRSGCHRCIRALA
jgi:hypothetical protein